MLTGFWRRRVTKISSGRVLDDVITQAIEVHRKIRDLRDGIQLIQHDYAERIRQFGYPARQWRSVGNRIRDRPLRIWSEDIRKWQGVASTQVDAKKKSRKLETWCEEPIKETTKSWTWSYNCVLKSWSRPIIVWACFVQFTAIYFIPTSRITVSKWFPFMFVANSFESQIQW